MRIQKLFLFAAATFLMGSGLAHADTTVEHACPQKLVQHEATDEYQNEAREPSSKANYQPEEGGYQPTEDRQVYHTRGWQ